MEGRLAKITLAACALLALASASNVGARQRRGSAGARPSRPPAQRGDSSAGARAAMKLLQAGRLEEAEATARAAVSAAPRDAEAHGVLGFILAQRGRVDEAERELREAVRLDPRSASALTNLGVLLVRASRAEEAVPVFEEVLRLDRPNG